MPLVDRPEPKLKPWLVAAALTSGSADTAAWCSPNMPVWSSLVPLGRASSLLGRLNWAKTLSICSLFSGYNFWRSSRPRRTCGSTRGGTCRRCRLSWCRGCCRCPVNCGRLDILPFFASKYIVNTVQWRLKKNYLGSCVWAFTAKTPRRKVANFILPSFLKVTPPSWCHFIVANSV